MRSILPPGDDGPDSGAALPQILAAPNQLNQEVKRLGQLAIEGAKSSPSAAMPAEPSAPSPSTAPSQADALTVASAAPALASAGVASVSSDVAPAEPPAPEPDNVAEIAIPRATPAKAADIPAPKYLNSPMQGVVTTGASDSSQAAPAMKLSATGRMEMSANSMSMRQVSRLRTLGIVMDILAVLLVVGVALGGWFIYRQLTAGNGP